MKILFNATTLNIGGALQAATNFIEKAISDSEVDWHFAISRQVETQLNEFTDITLWHRKFSIFDKTPAKNISFRKKLSSLEQAIKPNGVFTLFGPAYVNFHAPHIMGFAEPWVTHPNEYALALKRSMIGRVIRDAHTGYKRYWLRKADAWLVEAEIAKLGIQKILGSNSLYIGVLPNGCRDIFKHISTRANFTEADNLIQILYISAYYPHKNFEIVPYVARELSRLLPNRRFKFLLTIDSNKKEVETIAEIARRINVGNSIEFIGSVPVAQAADLYQNSHVAFIPSLLESFSATYSEAMTCGLPIVTSELNFATSICGDAALYFRPNDALHAAQQIAALITDSQLRTQKINHGYVVSQQLPSSQEKYAFCKSFLLNQFSKNLNDPPNFPL